ncbi:MAG: M1 family aminopeptidase [Acidobacteriota bacterium]
MLLKIAPLLILMLPFVSFSQVPPIGPGVSHELAVWRAARYSDVRYKLNLTLERMSPVLKGTIEIRVKVSGGSLATAFNPDAMGGSIQPPGRKSDDVIPPIVLDWRKIAGHEKDSTIANVTLNGQPMKAAGYTAPSNREGYYQDLNEHLIFGAGVVAGENVIKLDFTSPILTSGSAITRYVDKEDGAEYIYSLFVPSDASLAFPVFDQPDLKARFELDVKVEKQWKVISNSNIASITKYECTAGQFCANGFRFDQTPPISTYVFTFAVGEFGQIASYELPSSERVGGPDILTRFFFRKSQAAKFQPHAAELFRLVREGIKYLESYFDYKFPFPKYDLVLIPEFPFGGMEHAGATFVREQSIIFPTEPTKSDYINRATLIFHETAHQWFGDMVTMKWFDDLWLKEGFANFMAYKAMEKIMPETNAWKVFYERIKQPAYATDSTKGTTPIYQKIDNLSAAKSAYGNIVYNKAPAFLRQAESFVGEKEFQTGIRNFLKKYAFKNAEWMDLVSELQKTYGRRGLPEWAKYWITQPGVPTIRFRFGEAHTEVAVAPGQTGAWMLPSLDYTQIDSYGGESNWGMSTKILLRYGTETEVLDGDLFAQSNYIDYLPRSYDKKTHRKIENYPLPDLIFGNYQDYGYGIFLLDDKSRDYVLKNVQNEKDDFLRSMMYGALWDSVREGELDPKTYVELVIKNLPAEHDETITQSILGRTSAAMSYYLNDKDRELLSAQLEKLLIEKMQNAPTLGQRITFYRAFLNIASTTNARNMLKGMLAATTSKSIPLKTKDRFDIVTRLASLGDPGAPKLLADLEKTETSDDAKRYAYAAHAAFETKENREKFWSDFVNNKDISESWIEAAMGPFNSIRHDDLSLPYLQRALAELPNLKRNRKIFFVNGWLGAFIGGQKSPEALDIVNKFLADNPNLDNDLRLKILENVDVIERAVKIRNKFQH